MILEIRTIVESRDQR